MTPQEIQAIQATNFAGGWEGCLDQQDSMRGFSAARGREQSAHRRRVTEAARLMADAIAGKIDPWFVKQALQPTHEVAVSYLAEHYPHLYRHMNDGLALKETMSVTDYQALYVDVLDRMYYGYYQGFPVVNKPLVRIHQCRDFRIVSRYLLDGLVTPFTAMDAAAPPPQQAMSGPVPQDGSTFPTTNTAPIQYQPKLYQAMASVNWRAFVNDDLGIFKDIATRLALSANRGITTFINTLYTAYTGTGTGAGFNTALYNAGYANIINTANGASSTNPALGAQGLMDAWKILSGMKDSSGQPIVMAGRVICFYGPSNYAVAMNLKNMLSNHVSVEGGSQNSEGFPTQWIETNGWIAQNIEWVMDPYIQEPYNSDPGTWGLIVDPATQNRPAIEVGFLQGFEVPQLFQRVPNTMRMGGGVDPMMGDFLTMDQDTKIVSVFGGTQIDGRSTCASNGTGS
jgi:hypothetical protein